MNRLPSTVYRPLCSVVRGAQCLGARPTSLFLALLIGTGACGAGDGGGSRRFLSVGTAGTGGIYYPLGGVIASRLSLADTAHQFTAEVTGGSVENVQRIARGEIDLGFSMAVTAYEAYNGGADFATRLDGLRIVAPLYPNLTHVIVPGRSDIQSVAGLRGRRVSVGSPGSGTEQLAKQVLQAHDITYDDIEVRYLSFRESADALRDNAIDGAIFSVGYPASAVLEVMTTGGARLVPIDAQHGQQLVEHYPYYAKGSIPQSAYPGLDGDVPTLAVMNWVVATEQLEPTVVTHLLHILDTERAALTEVSQIAAQIDLTALGTAPIPLHPAAAAWLERRQASSP